MNLIPDGEETVFVRSRAEQIRSRSIGIIICIIVTLALILCQRTKRKGGWCSRWKKNAGANRVALIGIIVQNQDSAELVNSLLHLNQQFIVGRMGIPYREKEISIISIALDAPEDVVSALAGRLGMIPGVSSKTIYPKMA